MAVVRPGGYFAPPLRPRESAMPKQPVDPFARRKFLAFLAGSPLLAAAGIDLARLDRLLGAPSDNRLPPLDLIQQQLQEPRLIAAPNEALDIFDFEPVAKKKLPPAHWAYLATGTDDDATIRANREGFSRYEL